MSFDRIFAIFIRQFYLIRGNISRIFSIFIWSTIDVILWGFITKYLNTFYLSSYNFTFVLLTAIILWNFFIRCMHGFVMAFLEDVWTKNFINLFSSPISIFEYILGLILSSTTTTIIGFAIMNFVAFFLFKLFIFNFNWIILFLLVLFIFGISMGIFSSSIVLKFGPSAEWLIWPLGLVMLPFSCVFYPASILMNWMRFISYILPTTYVFEGLRAILEKKEFFGFFIYGFSLSLIYLFLAYLIFIKTYRYVQKTALIPKYSAENTV